MIAAVTLSACSSNDKTATSGTELNGPAGKMTTTTLNITKPTVTVPDTPPPTSLQIKDVTAGTGAEAKAGSSVQVHYVGVSYSTKKEFDSSWKANKTFSFVLGAGNVIPGWDKGVAGMKVGGRRQLTIPPDLGYGAQGSPPVIGPNETLVFVVDLVSVK